VAIDLDTPVYTTASIHGQDGWSGGGVASTDPMDPTVDGH